MQRVENLMNTIDPQTTTIINDGQFLYPVSTAILDAWTAVNGPITAKNYEQFCYDTDAIEGTPFIGSQEMIELCEELIANGAATLRP